MTEEGYNSGEDLMVQLKDYNIGNYVAGRSFWLQALWYFFGSPLFSSYLLPSSQLKIWLLRCFGAQVGQGVRIKPGVKVKFPWRLTIGDHVWIGEQAWLDNLAPIVIESDVCLSQGVYLCTGNHNWNDPNFALITSAILVKRGSWIAARSVVGPGVTIGEGAVLSLGSVASSSLLAMTIYAGNPAQAIKQRRLQTVSTSISHPSSNSIDRQQCTPE
jgi:putative colanic acid biosynthesis acetyltransferase WcaF